MLPAPEGCGCGVKVMGGLGSKNSDESEGFIKTPTRRREAEPTFDFFFFPHLTWFSESNSKNSDEFFSSPNFASLNWSIPKNSDEFFSSPGSNDLPDTDGEITGPGTYRSGITTPGR
jgi:hypothetical protein